MTKPTFSPLPETGRLSKEDASRYFSVFGFASFALGLINFAAQFALIYLCGFFAPSLLKWPLFSSVLVIVTMYGCGLPVFYLILRKLPKIRPIREKQSPKFVLGSLCACMCLVYVGNFVSSYLIYFVEYLMGREILNPVAVSAASVPVWGTLLFSVILAPIMEELVFRKLVCDRLLPLGEGYAVFLSAVLFAVAHGNFYQVFYAFLVGSCLGYLYVKTGIIRYTVLLHAAINFVYGFAATAISRLLDMEEMENVMNQMLDGTATPEQLTSFVEANLLPMLLTVGLSILQYGGMIAGLVILIRFFQKKCFHLEEGILPPPADARVSPIFLNMGVAAAIAVFTFLMIFSLL